MRPLRAHRRYSRSLLAGTFACAALAGLTACAAGQHAQTAEERPTLDGSYGTVGNIGLQAVSLIAPSGPSWPAGSSVPLTLYLANSGESTDALVDIRSPSFHGWTVTSESSLLSAANGSQSQTSAASSSATATPSPAASSASSTAASSASSSSATPAGGSAQPQTIRPASAISFGLGVGYGASTSPGDKALLLTGLTSKLYRGENVAVTFKFRQAGSLTLHVPVQIAGPIPTQSVSGTETSGGEGVPSGAASKPRKPRP